MKKLNKIITFFILILFPLLNYAEYSMPTIQFETPLTLNKVIDELQINTAKQIMNGLFYFALCFGIINVVRTFVFHPDRAKKVSINFLVGVLAYSILSNILGLAS